MSSPYPGSNRAAEAGPLDAADMLDCFPGPCLTIGCVVAASNDEATIAAVISALLSQTRVPDVIHVVVTGSSDRTVPTASAFAGPHETVTDLGEQFTEVFVHDIGLTPDGRAGALNYGFALVEGYDYLLSVDGDTVADPHALEHLVTEARADSRIGGISAIHTITPARRTGQLRRMLHTGQRAQLADRTLGSLLRGRDAPVLGGEFSLFATSALRTVMEATHQSTPWLRDGDLEDARLTLQLKTAGYFTRISALARAGVPAPATLREYDAQQVAAASGAIELMWPGQRGDITGQPRHPNLRQRWSENLGLLADLTLRIGFVTLAVASLSVGALRLSPLWLIPVAVAVLLNLRIALSLGDRRPADVLFAALVFPAELFLWVRLGHFLRSWSRFSTRDRTDGWVQRTETGGRRDSRYWMPWVAVTALIAVLVGLWLLLPPVVRTGVLAVGWPALGILAAVRTAFMIFKLLRRHRGYAV
ncbi:glycosyltransferase family 2 protein [Microbacterium sp. YJN-G]|uniref:glycosyltransferase family 2 protein n=1 Tax=Microbacterium sp. YJN-G TaxID=2763257 RepID=UPI001877934B|nr:glycosyltransferase [Microbacterium sp. YJN-G]